MLNGEMITAPADVLILPMTDDLAPAISFATALREAGLRAQLYTEQKKFKQKMTYADKIGVPFAAFLGEDEIAQAAVSVKDMTSGNQQTMPVAEAVSGIKAAIEARADVAPIKG